MTIHVADILVKAAAGKERVRPVDIVMGENWAEINLGSSVRLSLLNHILKQQKSGGGSPALRGDSNLPRISFEALRRSPQAMVKVIRKGGTSNARGMRDQMSYLEKDGGTKLESSERHFGAELAELGQEELIDAWGLSGESKTNSDKTTHFVVSFPADTDHGAAYRAGRAWAAEMFDSGTYGDVYDYYTAFHTDKAHPHIHVIVNRRGIEKGDWLKVSRRSQLNYDEFRAVQVEVAAQEGIYLAASPRLARGVSDRSIPDAEIRKAEREGRVPEAPSHTPVTALRAAATITLHSNQYSADADLLGEKYPDLSKIMKNLAGSLLAGHEIIGMPQEYSELTNHEVQKRSEFIMSRRNEILDDIKHIDDEIGSIPVGRDRSKLEQEASAFKAKAAQLMPDIAELQGHLNDNAKGYYRGINAEDGIEMEVKFQADQEVSELAENNGIDSNKFIGRYDGGRPASEELTDSWRKDELEDIQNNLIYREAAPQNQYEQLAQAAYDELHRNALQTYRQAERQLEAHAVRKKELHRIAKLIREGRRLDKLQEQDLGKSLRETLSANELKQLEAGQSEVLRFITQDIDQQRALGRRFLEVEIDDANSSRKLQLKMALNQIDRQADLASQQSAKLVQKDRGLDL